MGESVKPEVSLRSAFSQVSVIVIPGGNGATVLTASADGTDIDALDTAGHVTRHEHFAPKRSSGPQPA